MANDEGTIYVAHWTHTPENCPGRTKDGAKMLSDFWASREEVEKKGIKILGSYVTVTEKTTLKWSSSSCHSSRHKPVHSGLFFLCRSG